MRKRRDAQPGYGRLLDAWTPPPDAGSPIGCVATTFTFDPVFFEEQCLGRLVQMETGANEDGRLYLVEREEKLSQLACAAVLVDQHNCRGTRSLRWDLLPARIQKGILHAKVSLLAWSNLVRLVVASANLTPDGYQRNQEIFGVLDYHEASESPLECLREVLDFLGDASAMVSWPPPQCRALGRWQGFLKRVRQLAVTKSWGRESTPKKGPRVHLVVTGPGKPDAFAAIQKNWPSGGPPKWAVVTSPFFDPPENDQPNKPAEALWDLLNQKGEATAEFNVIAEEIPGEEKLLVHAPRSLIETGPLHRPDVEVCVSRLELDGRPLHAKSLWLESDYWWGHLIGSSNFTTAGLGLGPRTNIEANLLYLLSRAADKRSLEQFAAGRLDGQGIDPDACRWLEPDSAANEDEPSSDIVLPAEFGPATFRSCNDQSHEVVLAFSGQPPAGWSVQQEESTPPLYDEARWLADGIPAEVRIPWPMDHAAPSGFNVRWLEAAGPAWWPVNVEDARVLPPPDELRNLSLDDLVRILSSARPLHVLLRELSRSRQIARQPPGPEIDPHRRVDTSGFLLQRTRRVSLALSRMRERLEQPVGTVESLAWRLHGPVGVKALANAILKEGVNHEEKSFLLTELALELSRVQPKSCAGCLPPARVREAIRQTIGELRADIQEAVQGAEANLGQYVEAAFEEAGI